jgi:hypothetical protein
LLRRGEGQIMLMLVLIARWFGGAKSCCVEGVSYPGPTAV